MPKLGAYAFGERLLSTGDLDPVYILLWEARFEQNLLQRWLLAYWCFYHTGTASWIVDQSNYWQAIKTAASSKTYPRGHERRHFRGSAANKSVLYLEHQGLSRLFAPLTGSAAVNYSSIAAWVKSWYGFGDWIAFKVADMLERLAILRVQFDVQALNLFDSPREGARLLWNQYAEGDPPEHVQAWAVERLLNYFNAPSNSVSSHLPALAPPRHERPLNVQEAETILCKWKSYLNGQYHIGADIEDNWKALHKFNTPTARKLVVAGKKGRLW